MAIVDVLRAFREMKREGTIEDYLLYGSVAAMVHTEPFYTDDIDVGVTGELDMAGFARVFSRLAEFGTIQGHGVVVGDTAVDVFPVDFSPVIEDGAKHAVRKRVEGMVVKVVPPEHLLLEALRVNRFKDRVRVSRLDEVVDRRKLRNLFRRLDPDGTLAERYRGLAGRTP